MPPHESALGQGTGGGIAVAVAAALLAAVAWRFFRYTDYSLFLTTAGGEKQAITSRDRAFMLKLRDKLNDAIASGGGGSR